MKGKAHHIALLISLTAILALLSGCKAMYLLNDQEKVAANAIREYQKELKDPESMVVFDDIVCVSDNKGFAVVCFKASGKNSFGAYAGATKVEVYTEGGSPVGYATENSEYFLDVQIFSSELKHKYSVTEMDGQRISNYIGCKHK